MWHKQKTDRKFKDFALGRPYNQHEMVLVDEHNKLYYANLKYHDPYNRCFLYKKIVDTAHLKGGTSKKAKTDAPEVCLSDSEIKRVWMYDNLVGLHQTQVSPGKKSIGDDIHSPAEGISII